MSGHLVGVELSTKQGSVMSMEEYEYPYIFERHLYEDLADGLDDGEPIKSGLVVDRKDEIFDVLTALETNFALE